MPLRYGPIKYNLIVLFFLIRIFFFPPAPLKLQSDKKAEKPADGNKNPARRARAWINGIVGVSREEGYQRHLTQTLSYLQMNE